MGSLEEGSTTCPKRARLGFQGSVVEGKRKNEFVILHASGPLSRMTPMPARPSGVEMAAMVSSLNILVSGFRLLVSSCRKLETRNQKPETYFVGRIVTLRFSPLPWLSVVTEESFASVR